MVGAWQIWLIIAVLLAVGEILTTGFFVFWFALGAGVAALAAWLGVGIYWQIILFLATSLILVIFTRPLVQRFAHRSDPDIKTNLEAIAGKSAVVTEEIDNVMGSGQVKMEGEIWSARSGDSERLPVGTRVTVHGVDGVKLIVKKEAQE